MAEAIGARFTGAASSSIPKSRLFTFSNQLVQFPTSPSSISLPRFCSKKRTGLKTSCTIADAASTDKSNHEEEVMSVDNLHRFVNLNIGKWNGSFYQFDAKGNLLQNVTTKLSASSYGEDELISLIQTLYIKQPPSSTSIAGQEKEPEWTEYKIKETNMFTVDKYQQIGFFPKEKAFSLRYQMAGMLETVLRAGVLGEDDTGEENPRNLKIPSRRPSIVCENCLYSLHKDRRIRAFHILDPKGVVDMLILFIEDRGNETPLIPSISDFQQSTDRLSPFLGRWEGRSVTKRSGVYGASIAEADTVVLLEIDADGKLIQDINSTSKGSTATSNVHWTGSRTDNLVTFHGGYDLTLLPGGVYMGCPSDVSKNVAESQSFHLELCWLESPDRRQRLVRTYDWHGLAVSSTYFYEVKV
ncbi:hypothetical protein LUZ62_025107 [Rhynchospora pubera]|uniref:DUF3598 domain-containing protein n=1 Tax=Rhynchospora pubera TaxID=906938 RepID=A0AAV8H8L2_9POAL|nr:hypothetical protein LUZ62_025107 [Rhynchospora pubera]